MSTTLGSKATKTFVTLNYKGTPTEFKVLHHGKPSSIYDNSFTGGTILCFKYATKLNKAWDGTNNDFENSDCRTDVEAMISGFDADIQGQIMQVKIPYHKGVGNSGSDQSGANGLPVKLFPLSMKEYGFTESWIPNDGAKLDAFSDNASRVMTDASGAGVYVWSRSAYTNNGTSVGHVDTDGTASYNFYASTNLAVCPAFVLPSTLLVSDTGAVVVNAPPEISSSVASGTNMGVKNAPVALNYTVTDQDNDTTTVREYIDNIVKRQYTAVLGRQNTFQALNDEASFRKILNGNHTVKINATDSQNNSTDYTVSFSKSVKSLQVSLETPIAAASQISAAQITLSGSIPADAVWLVEVTNNANDANPTWEDCTIKTKTGFGYAFKNTVAENGYAFNFRVRLSRGASDNGGYLEQVHFAYETEE